MKKQGREIRESGRLKGIKYTKQVRIIATLKKVAK
jgi:hypothetical protein